MRSNHNRSSSIELLRLILMVMIIIHHCIVHGLGLSALSPFYSSNLIIPYNEMPIWIGINSCCICAVNCFILISGYFKIKVTSYKFINLLFTLCFYSILLTIVPDVIDENWKEAIRNSLFLTHSPYWFVIDYLFLMVFAPMLNLAFDTFLSSKRRLIILGLLIISCYFGFVWGHSVNINGYTLLQFITMYCIGREIKLSQFSMARTPSILLYIISSGICAVLCWLFWDKGYNQYAWRVTYYNNPLLILSSIGLFVVFMNGHIQSKLINRIALSAFGIYLFQSSPCVASLMYTH